MVPDVNAGVSVPALMVRLDKLALFEIGGVTDTQVRPALISSISAFGDAVLLFITTEAKVVTGTPSTLLFEIPPPGSVPPKEAGLTHKVAISGPTAVISYFTTTRYVVPKFKSVAISE